MSRIDRFLSRNSSLNDVILARTTQTQNHINDKPSVIIIRRGGTTLAAQTVRIEYNSTSSKIDANTERELTVFALPTANIQQGDEFGISGDTVGTIYQVYDKITLIGEVQAYCRRIE